MLRRKSFAWLAAAFLVAAIVGTVGELAAQEAGTIRGRVTVVGTEEAVSGAQVFIPGTGQGVLTNESGVFTLSGVPAGVVRLRVRSLGYADTDQAVTVRSGETVEADFEVAVAALSMEALVVTATGLQRKVELGNSLAVIDVTQVVAEAPITNTSSLLTGRAAGVQVIGSGGTVGTGSRVRIRGNNSVSISNEPLIIMDGIRVSNDSRQFLAGAPGSISFETGGQSPSRLDDINPEEIESIEIVKGPSAAALYGTKAANGVILITTKRGREGRPDFRVYAEAGANTERTDFPSNWQGVDANGDGCQLFDVRAGLCTQVGVNSFNPLEHDHTTPFQTGLKQRYGASIGGGTASGFSYFISADYQDEEGVTEVNQLQKFNLRGNFSVKPTDNLDITVSNGYLNSDLGLTLNDNFSIGLIGAGMSGFATDEINEGWGGFRPEEIFTIDTRQFIDRFTNATSVDWRTTSWLQARATVGVDITNRFDSQFFPTGEAPAFNNFEKGAKFANRWKEVGWTANAAVTASANVSSSVSSRTSVGFQYVQDQLKGTISEGRELVVGTSSIAGAAITLSREQTIENKTLGAFVEQQFGFGDRFFVTGAARLDNNSAFGENFGAVVYPKVGASWLASDASWQGAVNSLRFRAAWGQSGLQPGTTDALRFFDPVPVSLGGTSVTGVTFGGLGNADLKPERSTELEAGFDVAFFDSWIELDFTFYNKTTKDALILRELPPSLGAGGGRFENLGSVRNRGIEAQLITQIVRSYAADISVTFNASYNENTLRDLGEDIPPIVQRFQRMEEGFPLGGYWETPIESFADSNGDGMIDQTEITLGSEKVYLGTPFAPTTLSSFLNFTFVDAITLFAFFDYRGGYTFFNFTEAWRHGQNNTRGLNDPSAPLEEQARSVASKFLGTDAGYMENANFLKFRELSLNFDAPASWARAIGASRLGLQLGARNLVTWTDYTGFDPELNESGQANFVAREFLTQPQLRSFIARLNLSF